MAPSLTGLPEKLYPNVSAAKEEDPHWWHKKVTDDIRCHRDACEEGGKKLQRKRGEMDPRRVVFLYVYKYNWCMLQINVKFLPFIQ